MEQQKKPTYKYCIVPCCKNTIRNAPDKVFFLVPRGMDIRRKWCKIMKRDMISPSTCLYCCEDHFNVEEDTHNYIQYKIMNLQEKHKTVLRLKKGIVPHKFECQMNTESQPPPKKNGLKKRRHLETIEDIPSKENISALKTTRSSENYLEASTSSTSSHIHTEDIKMEKICETDGSTSLSNVYNENIMQDDIKMENICEADDSTSLSTVYNENIIQDDIKMENICDSDDSSSVSNVYNENIMQDDVKMENICDSDDSRASLSNVYNENIIQDGIKMEKICEANDSTSLSNVYNENTMQDDIKMEKICKADCSTSLSNVYNKNVMQVDKAIQVNSDVHYRSEHVDVNLCAETKNKAASEFRIATRPTSTCPLKTSPTSGKKRRLLHENLDMRTQYNNEPFLEKHLVSKEPFGQFQAWFEEACNREEILEPNAMCLSTVNKNGFPSARLVLCKGYGKDGFKFFTNYGSRKAREMEDNPNVAATFYWEALNRSVRIEGYVEKLDENESTKYFQSRPVHSQIAACASAQSTPIESRDALCNRVSALLLVYTVSEKEIPKPSLWGGYIIRPRAVEFWQGDKDRLSDRIKFRKPEEGEFADGKILHEGEDGWVYERLAP